MTKFKPGDRVKCIDPGGQPFIKEGEIYTVDHYKNYKNHELLALKDQGGYGHYEDRFELIPQPKFKIGDIVGSIANKEKRYKIIDVTDTEYVVENHQRLDPNGTTWMLEKFDKYRYDPYKYDHTYGDALFFLIEPEIDPLEVAKRLYVKWYKENGEHSTMALAAFLREAYNVKAVLNYIPAKEEITFESI